MSHRKELAAMFRITWARTGYFWLSVFWGFILYGTYNTFF
jgi:hypothetical protein